MRRALAAVPVALVLGAGDAALGQWRLAHDEDFRSARELDASFWTVETGFLRNREAQYYRASNIAAGGGALVLEARREQVPNAAHRAGAGSWRTMPRLAQYTSASIVSRRSFRYARVEVVARSPSGAGVWPAIWMVHESPGQYGEIDIFEAVGKHPDTAFAGVHWGREPRTRQHRNGSLLIPGFEGSWRRHTLEWTPERIAIFVDDRLLFSFDPRTAASGERDPLRQPMLLHINLALGGNWGGAIDDTRLPARFEIASVRVWRWAPGEAGSAAEPPPQAVAPVPPASPPAALRSGPARGSGPGSVPGSGFPAADATFPGGPVVPPASPPPAAAPAPAPDADPAREPALRWGR